MYPFTPIAAVVVDDDAEDDAVEDEVESNGGAEDGVEDAQAGHSVELLVE